MKLYTTNELGNYTVNRLAFLLKEKPAYETKYLKENKDGKVQKQISAYFTRAEIVVTYDYYWREIVISTNTKKYVLSLMFSIDGNLSTEYLDMKLKEVIKNLPPF